MNERITQSWNWVWPDVGAIPIYQSLDSEMFDRTDYPFYDTFVREAIQNSLDARLDQTQPVRMSFSFHDEEIGPRCDVLKDVITHRKKANLDIPEEWESGKISWLVVQDFNSKGLSGSLTDRSSDFWVFWLNFGLSNKKGDGRGGRGIGRVAFLIASRLQSLIGYTRRSCDGSIAVCGMTVLRAHQHEKSFKSTHAFLAERVNNNIYDLHDSTQFHDYIRDSLYFTGYEDQYQSGFGLAVLYPYPELSTERILAAAIEHFAPAIMDETLTLTVNGETLDAASITNITNKCEDHFKDKTIRGNGLRLLDLVRQTISNPAAHLIKLPTANKKHFEHLRNTSEIVGLQRKLVEKEEIVLEVQFPLYQAGSTTDVSLRATIGANPSRQRQIDRLFREGMSLPEVKSNIPSELDLIMLVGNGKLAKYLNFCEGKAHLDLLASNEVKAELKKHGFDGLQVRHLVKSLPRELRHLLTPDATVPDAEVFDRFFSKPAEKQNKNGRRNKPVGPDEPDIPIPPANPPVFIVETLNDGLRAYSNPEFSGWPVNVRLRLAYADGTRHPKWHPLDFRLEDLNIKPIHCELLIDENVLRVKNCGRDTEIVIRGFDTNREVDVRIRRIPNA